MARIDRGDPARRQYEAAYRRWIPGNARDALLAVFLFGDPADNAQALKNAIPGLSRS